MRGAIAVVVLAVALGGCEKKKSEGGLPPASDWQAPSPGQPAGSAVPTNPHAGMDVNDPHAGVDMSNPHGGSAGSGGGVDVAQLGLPPPETDKPVDPNKFIRGKVETTAATKDKVKPGGVLFVMVRKPDASGAPSGPPLAVTRLAVDKWPVSFELTEANAMIGGTAFSGDVVVMARYDQDSDALSKQPGDLTGLAKATIPAKDVAVKLDTVLP